MRGRAQILGIGIVEVVIIPFVDILGEGLTTYQAPADSPG